MFVADLDRPWLETPFLLQGFLIESAEDIARLQACCRHVVIDRERSVGDQYVAAPRDGKAMPGQSGATGHPATAPRPPLPAANASAESDFLPIARRLRERRPATAPHIPRPRLAPSGGPSRLESELLQSAPIIEDVHRTLDEVRNAIDADARFDLARIGGLVEEMAAGVERNPDAMLWLTRLKRTDRYSYDHAVDVSVHLMVFARFLGLPRGQVEELGFAGLMQDVGKVRIAAELLARPGPLSADEYLEVQSHVASSLDILAVQPGCTAGLLEIVAAHHERFDGSGYPRRLQGERLALHAELAGMIDTYCAMIRQRPYSSAVSSQHALESLIRLRGSKFREALVDQFIQCLGLYPIGTLVELNTGEVAVVIQQNQVRRLKPRLLILLAPDKQPERHSRSLDLMLDPLTPTGEPYRIRHALPLDAYGIDPAEFYLD
jgi:HD-GYP domain-containing protein (c-di-GMP phosphodiesterase class II)